MSPQQSISYETLLAIASKTMIFGQVSYIWTPEGHYEILKEADWPTYKPFLILPKVVAAKEAPPLLYEEALRNTERYFAEKLLEEMQPLLSSGLSPLEESSDAKAVIPLNLFLIPNPVVKAKEKPCWDTAKCRGQCKNPFHTKDNVRFARYEAEGMTWGEILERLEEEDIAERRALKRAQKKMKTVCFSC